MRGTSEPERLPYNRLRLHRGRERANSALAWLRLTSSLAPNANPPQHPHPPLDCLDCHDLHRLRLVQHTDQRRAVARRLPQPRNLPRLRGTTGSARRGATPPRSRSLLLAAVTHLPHAPNVASV